MNYFFQKMVILALETCKCLNLWTRFARRILEIHVKFALYHAVIELAALIRRAAVAAFKERIRAEDILLHRRIFRRAAERRVKLLCLFLIEQALTIGRIGEQDAAAAVIALGRVRLLEEHCACNEMDSLTHSGSMSLPTISKRAVASAMQSASSRACCQTALSKQVHFSASKRRSRPGARRCAIIAASIAIVPEPQNGSRNGSLPRQRASLTIAAASVSRSGAALLFAR